jgi:hypothetical protein
VAFRFSNEFNPATQEFFLGFFKRPKISGQLILNAIHVQEIILD